MTKDNQLKIFSINHNDECYGKIYLSNVELNNLSNETDFFNKECDTF